MPDGMIYVLGGNYHQAESSTSEWFDSLCATFDDADFFGGEVVEVVDEVVDLGFEGLDVGGGIGLLGGEDAVDERFDFLLLLINNRYNTR